MKRVSFKLKDQNFNFPNLESIIYDPSITHLEVIDGSYSQLPEELFLCHHLKLIDLKGSKVEFLPAKIFELKNLETLKIHHGVLKQIESPSKINKTLTTLFLNKNQISILPNNIAYLTHLKRLNLDHNVIQDIPVEFCALDHLSHLSIEENPLSENAKRNLWDFFKLDY